ncbi:hypothetical protein, unlikely [Trypanosoma brucei brucei TREU927]|uniref:Uncharacterized protein n=1 Tax=Trypanosoma brucei brucei (strain 927/4 GUTat10.1) TaxID=185431 RepID=Q38F82_TRYB2|nr:hypothetical protein, unlikely [Trypanosoma brucei brucei TREU927]EAN76538.1 hypothetical protein, unlikely [Trypanosoma brucei brucei TREU927]
MGPHISFFGCGGYVKNLGKLFLFYEFFISTPFFVPNVKVVSKWKWLSGRCVAIIVGFGANWIYKG